MRISDYEGRLDWPQIVLRVPCSDCGAQPGSPCRNQGAAPGTLWADAPRSDHHRVRKELAILIYQQRQEISLLEQIAQDFSKLTPNRIRFTEITMLPTVGGNTLVYTGTLSPNGSAFPAGTTFTVTSNDPNVTPTVDPTGLIVTIPLPDGWVESTTLALAITWETSTFVPVPSSSPSQITEVITPSAAPSLTNTPTSVNFAQTT